MPGGACELCGGPLGNRNLYGVCQANPVCNRERDHRKKAAYAARRGPLPVCGRCGGPILSSAVYGVCKRNPECKAEANRRQLVALRMRRGGRPRAYCPACGGEVKNAARHRCLPRESVYPRPVGKLALRRAAALAALLDARPRFVAEWFEASPADRPGFAQVWADANRGAHLRAEAPALARLELEGRPPLYGISGGVLGRAAPWPGPGSGIPWPSWDRHAEGDVFAQAVAAGWTGGWAVLSVDRPLCHWCAVAVPGFTRVLGLAGLNVADLGPGGGPW
jgi:hypothetical protein